MDVKELIKLAKANNSLMGMGVDGLHFGAIEKVLTSDDTVRLAFTGKVEKDAHAFVLTDEKMIIGRVEKLMNATTKEIFLNEVRDIKSKTRLLKSFIIFDALTEIAEVQIHTAAAEQVFKECRELISQSRKQPSTIVSPTQSADDADTLRKFKQLLDEGIITQEEFDKKKEQILG